MSFRNSTVTERWKQYEHTGNGVCVLATDILDQTDKKIIGKNFPIEGLRPADQANVGDFLVWYGNTFFIMDFIRFRTNYKRL